MREIALTADEGLNLLRLKGPARARSFYELTNCYRTADKTVKARPGTFRDASLPVGTIGLTAFQDKLHVFASTSVDLTGFDDYQLNILLHPTNPTAILTEIHFAEPFLGALYIVAEFIPAGIFHFWLQEAEEWEASTEYSSGEFVEPTTPNGFVYRATRLGDPFQAWAPGVPRTEGNSSSIEASVVEPTVYNEYYYTVVDTQGDNPISGTIEPVWPTNTGAQVIENTDGTEQADQEAVAPPLPPSTNKPQSGTTSKYGL